jgi:thiol-disulfide isomerase/thioredoxin
MRHAGIMLLLALTCAAALTMAQETADGPTDGKAQKTFQDALKCVEQRKPELAFEEFKKADKQDGGHCKACQRKMMKYGVEFRDWKAAETGASEMAAEAQGDHDVALAHQQFGVILMDEAFDKHKDEIFARAHEEFKKALAIVPNFPAALYLDGQALAHMKHDDEAKAQFALFVKMAPANDAKRGRAIRFIEDPELARARMAPAFAITTIDGRKVSIDDLQGKVVLIDFWATWCGPCREALPHIKEIAKKFQGQPLVILSVSLDTDEEKWKQFVNNNGMDWLQARDGGFTGPVSRLFSVDAIPHTFTIDSDGILQDEHIGDASIEGKLKKLVKRANESEQAAKPGK